MFQAAIALMGEFVRRKSESFRERKMKIDECLSCADCEFNAEHACSYCDARPAFCSKHFVRHLVYEHYNNRAAELQGCEVARAMQFPERHPCKWHEGDDPVIQDPNDPENYMPPGCCNCGAMYPTKDCEDTPLGPGCGLEFLDWGDKSRDDVMAGPYVTASGDLYCMRCGPEMDEREEQECENENYYEFDYLP